MTDKTNTEDTSQGYDTGSSFTPSTSLLNKKLRKSPGPRMLTRSEIDLLRRSANEIAQAVRDAHSQQDGRIGASTSRDDR